MTWRPSSFARLSRFPTPPLSETMGHPGIVVRIIAVSAVLAGSLTAPGAASRAASGDALSRGKYLFNAAGCGNCHTDTERKGPLLGGGPALKTPFGTFYGPNISSHRDFGIGKWSEADFIRAMRKGVSPNGAHYYPAFPYTSFTRMTDVDRLIDRSDVEANLIDASQEEPWWRILGCPLAQSQPASDANQVRLQFTIVDARPL